LFIACKYLYFFQPVMSPNLLHTILGFQEANFGPKDFAELIRNGLGFTPAWISTNLFFRSETDFNEDAVERIENFEPDIDTLNITLREQDIHGGSFSTADTANLQSLHWYLRDYQLPPAKTLNCLLADPSFVAGFAVDDLDMSIQSEESAGNYGVYGLKYNGPTYWSEFWQEWLIDISGNPGRAVLCRGTWLMAAWKMWFGPHFFQWMPKEQLLAFPYGRVSELPSGVVEIQLYKAAGEAGRSESRSVQQTFRNWVNMDELEKLLKY
jgi:hypothetical protein